MVRVLIFLSILAASAHMPTLIRAQECSCNTTVCDDFSECGCDTLGGCDAVGGCSSGCGQCDSFWTRDRLLGDLFGPKSCLNKDLGLDSIDHYELLMRLEDSYSHAIPKGHGISEEDASKWQTVGDIMNYFGSQNPRTVKM